MADGGVLEGLIEGIGSWVWVSADAGDDESGGRERAGDSRDVADVAFSNGEVGEEGGFGDLAAERRRERSLEDERDTEGGKGVSDRESSGRNSK